MVNYSRAAVSLKTLFQFPLLADFTSMLLLTLRLSGKQLRDKRLLVENFTKQQQQQVTKVEQFIVNTTKRRNNKI